MKVLLAPTLAAGNAWLANHPADTRLDGARVTSPLAIRSMIGTPVAEVYVLAPVPDTVEGHKALAILKLNLRKTPGSRADVVILP